MRTNNNMPTIDLNICGLTEWEMSIAKGILNKGKLRASNPKPPEKVKVLKHGASGKGFMDWEYIYQNEEDRIKGYTAYVWRDVAFSISPISAHHCMPVSNDFNLEGSYSSQKEIRTLLHAITDKIIKSVPKTQWYGIARWGKVFGNC
jgi:hypothetical protein